MDSNSGGFFEWEGGSEGAGQGRELVVSDVQVLDRCDLEKNDFIPIHTPILASNNAEGAGEMFGITTALTSLDTLSTSP
ncbi:asparaginyl-trna synthetase [Moniliophthora roreri]|nr:asparaginyl-trna synthetase [Moniliophthora roreri]